MNCPICDQPCHVGLGTREWMCNHCGWDEELGYFDQVIVEEPVEQEVKEKVEK